MSDINKMKVAAKKINNPECNYLTEGRRYDVIDQLGVAFCIEDNRGCELITDFKGCNHINGDWTIIGNPAVAVKQQR